MFLYLLPNGSSCVILLVESLCVGGAEKQFLLSKAAMAEEQGGVIEG